MHKRPEPEEWRQGDRHDDMSDIYGAPQSPKTRSHPATPAAEPATEGFARKIEKLKGQLREKFR